MACFTTWTVLPHSPIEKLAENLWRVTGDLGSSRRQMMVARMSDGRLVIHNGIALDDAGMKELEAWGEPAVLIVPNAYHRQDAAIWKQRYPKMTVVAPSGAKKRVDKIVAVDKVVQEAPSDATVKLEALDGCPGELVMVTTTDKGVTLTFCDAVLNMPKLGFPMNVLLGPTGTISSPRAIRWLSVKDKKAFASHLERLAATPNLERLALGHGKPISDDAPGALRKVVSQLGG